MGIRLTDIEDPRLRRKVRQKLGLPAEEKAPAKRRHLEAAEQKRVVAWARDHESDIHPALAFLHASLNAGRRHRLAGYELQEQGMLAGVCDLFLPLPMGRYHGLYIEMKSSVTGGRPTAEQIIFMNWGERAGYCVAVAYDAQPAIALLEWYCRGALGVPPIALWQPVV